MTDYFSDRQFGSNPRIEEKIDKVAWDGILSLIQIKIDDGSLAYGFPSHCPDGNAIDGTNVSAFSARVRAEIHDLAGEHSFSWEPPPDSLPSTLAILDFIEFIARNIGEPTRVGWHDYHSHHHLKIDRDAGLEKFVEDINRIFSRNGLAYELSESGAIERTVPAPMADLVKRTSSARATTISTVFSIPLSAGFFRRSRRHDRMPWRSSGMPSSVSRPSKRAKTRKREPPH